MGAMRAPGTFCDALEGLDPPVCPVPLQCAALEQFPQADNLCPQRCEPETTMMCRRGYLVIRTHSECPVSGHGRPGKHREE
jgi:hypothetical protein